MPKAPRGKVRCDSCRRLYPAIYEEHDQGVGCAATYVAESGMLYGHYGSAKIDTEVYRVTNPPKWLKPGTLCDKCIEKLEKENRLELRSRFL